MKYLQLLLLTLPLLTHTYPAAEEKSIALDDVTVDNEAVASAKDSQLQKRSGSTDYVVHLKSGLLSSLGHASASLASSSSGGSSSGGYGGGGYKPHGDGHHGHSVEFDPWSLKKTVLNTIFQAVKAITGGVTALKGQLIKGSGYALSASGNLVAASGDKVTDVGKYIINSAQAKLHPIPTGGGGGGGSFGKFASLSGASSGGSSGSGGGKHTSGQVIHTDTITSYEIPNGHTSYGPPSKAPTYSSATHQYLPPSGSAYPGGSSGYGGGHVAFEEPSSNYLPTAYGPDVHYNHQRQPAAGTGQEFNIYGRHHKLNDEEARKAAVQLQEILNMLPNGKTEYTASKTVQLDTSNVNSGYGGYGHTGAGDQVDLNSYGLPSNLGPLESLSHTESITAAYAADIYHQMQKQKLSPEELYIQKHPQEGYDYNTPTKNNQNTGGYKYDNYQTSSGGPSAHDALKDLTPIIAALEVAKRQPPAKAAVSFAVEKNVHKVPPPQQGSSGPKYQLPPAVQKTKYIYYEPTPSRYQEFHSQSRPAYNGPYKVRRHVANVQTNRPKRKASMFRTHDYGNQENVLYNPLIGGF